MALEDLVSPYDIPSGSVFHFALAVPDLPAAMDLLGPALQLDWTSIWSMTREMETPEGHTSDELQAVYSRQGPPYVELVSGQAGGFFAAEDGARLHHVGYIVDDVRAEAERLQALGLTIWSLNASSAFVTNELRVGRGCSPPASGLNASSAFVTNELGVTLEVMGPGIRQTLDEWFARPSG